MESNAVNGSNDASARQTDDKDKSAELSEVGSDADTSALEAGDVQATDTDKPDLSVPLPRPYLPKIVELRLRGTPAQIAVHIKDLSNEVLGEAGYLPFLFDLPTNLRDRSIKKRFRSDLTEIPRIIVYPADFDRPFEPGEPLQLPETNLANIGLLPGRRDGRMDFTIFRFSCNELDWPQYEPRLTQLCDLLTDRGFPVVTDSEIEQFLQPNTEPGGRPPDVDYDWAFDEIHIKGRDPQQVYREWLKRQDPYDSRDPSVIRKAFNEAMKRRRKKRVGTK